MTAEYCQWERRSSVRHTKPGRVWWRTDEADKPSLAWLTDESRSGMAFVSPAADTLKTGELIGVSHVDPRKLRASFDPMRISRVESYGVDLRLVACTRFL